MKTKFIVVILSIFLLSSFSYAQKKKKSITDIVGSEVSMGKTMSSIVSGLNNSSFANGKSGKKDLISQLSGIKGTDYLQYASVAGELAGALKETSFLPDWASKKDGILDQIQTASSIAGVASGLSGIFGMLSPDAMGSKLLKNKGSISTALNVLSILK
jgi:hypothetical protein